MKKTFIAKIQITLPDSKVGYVGDKEACKQIKDLLKLEIDKELDPKISVNIEQKE